MKTWPFCNRRAGRWLFSFGSKLTCPRCFQLQFPRPLPRFPLAAKLFIPGSDVKSVKTVMKRRATGVFRVRDQIDGTGRRIDYGVPECLRPE